MKLKKSERHRLILIALAANSGMTVSDLAEELAVSKQTIRRDLDELSENGEVNRTFGGASSPRVGQEPNLAERGQTKIAERTQISDVASRLIKEGETIMIGAGVTTSYLAQTLARRFQRLQILTNNLSAATILAKSRTHRVILLPGDYDPMEGCVVGSETLAFIDKFRADVAVIGASGIDGEGLYEVHSGIAWVDRVMMRRSNRNIAILPDDRFGHAHLEQICLLSELDDVVTNTRPANGIVEALRRDEVELHYPGQD